MRRGLSLGLLLILLPLAARAADALPARDAPPPDAVRIEADWLRQEAVRYLPPTPRNRPETAVTPAMDAAGGCDGVKDGTYGFHTGQQESPWWQVDLGEPQPIARVAVYNRCDGNVEARAARIEVLLSTDGTSWTSVYRHDGAVFRGQADGKPLEIALPRAAARHVRLQLPGVGYFHLDEVEVYAPGGENVALHQPALQSSVSPWSKDHGLAGPAVAEAPVEAPVREALDRVLQRGRRLADDLGTLGADVVADRRRLEEAAGGADRRAYLEARWAVRRMALANPQLDFDAILFVKRVPGTFTHMSDQYYGWWSRPGGGLYVLEGFRSSPRPLAGEGPGVRGAGSASSPASDFHPPSPGSLRSPPSPASGRGETVGSETQPTLRCLTANLPPGSVLRPDLSYDGKRALFAYCQYVPGLREEPNKLDKDRVPEEAFYHLFEINLDGSGLRQLTHGKYDDFDGRYLPDGRIVFLSTRRGQALRWAAGDDCASDPQAPDCYVRCGGGPERPVAVYTLHAMQADGSGVQPLSPFEMFEWTPSIAHDGRILYARWDYIDRWNMPFMSLWSTLPDGTGTRAVFGNYTQNPHCIFEPRSIPGSQKLIVTASGHHANTGGSLVLLDPGRAADGPAAMTRLTPEVCFPETEGWPKTYFANPYPLSENHYLVAWSDQEMIGWPGPPEPVNASGIYLFDAFGNLELLYRDPAISSETPIPVRPRSRPPALPAQTVVSAKAMGRMLVADVTRGLEDFPPGTVRRLRLVAVPPKTHPTMNYPSMGLTADDPGKAVLGTVPVEADGSAYFHVPAGVTLFFQALDERGVAVQTMRSAAYVQPGETLTCIGCHERRNTAPPARLPRAAAREPSRIAPGPEGSWPFDYAALVQPVLDRLCVECHRPGGKDETRLLTAEKSYETLVDYGQPSLRQHVLACYQAGRSAPGGGASATSPLVQLLEKGHYDARLSADDWERLFTWLDTYGQRRGAFSAEQETQLRGLWAELTPILKVDAPER